ncbi:GAF and ANTAR domain-containing protein [Streptomyces sp. NBC_01476]|uniref:GAF and ANTAR domain-containing protein n=1 Tax=Streptomyces sp. NBC_01476 TaxID=2903881 RepID=UPI002E33E2EF|nr:GAF and ANTAR domain-containing protein [Streptomyces sp. NBC_01476]
MTTGGGRSDRIEALVAEEAARRGERVDVVHVCAAMVAALPVDGAGVSAMSPAAGSSYPLCGTDDISRSLEELQLTLGEGPCMDAFALGEAVLSPDLRAPEVRARWPAFTAAAVDSGAGAVFALPLQIGAISPGVLDLYRERPGALDGEHLADAMAFADTATLLLLGGRAEGPERFRWNLGADRAQIDQATGMLTEQLGVGIEEAFLRLRAHAYAQGRRLTDVAADVVYRRLLFTPDSRTGTGTDGGTDPDTDPGAGRSGDDRT